MFGADPTGAADSTTAFQTAINWARGDVPVVIPAGTYLLGPLKAHSGTTLRPVTGASVTLRARDNTGGHLISPHTWASAVTTGVTIQDLRLEGNSAGQHSGGPMPGPSAAQHGIAILQGHGWLVERVTAVDFDGDGIYLGVVTETEASGSNDNIIRDCVCTDNIRNGGMISRGDRNLFEDCTFASNQVGMNPAHAKYDPAVYASADFDMEPNFSGHAADDNIFRRCAFGTPWSHGLQITRPFAFIRDNLFEDCTFTDCGLDGVFVKSVGATGNRWLRCTLSGNARRHMRLASAAGSTIESSTFIGATPADEFGWSVSIDDGEGGLGVPVTGVSVINNTFDMVGAGSKEVALRNCMTPTVTGNTLLNGATISAA